MSVLTAPSVVVGENGERPSVGVSVCPGVRVITAPSAGDEENGELLPVSVGVVCQCLSLCHYSAVCRGRGEWRAADGVVVPVSDPVSVFSAPSAGDEENGEPAAGEDELEEGELHDTSAEETPEFYNKTKSFFDNISCDAVEKTRE